MKDENMSNRAIANKIGRSEGVIRNLLRKGSKYGIKKKTRGSTKLTARDIGNIRRMATKERLNSSQILSELQLNVTQRHIRRILHNTPNMKWTEIQSKPRLTAAHKEARLAFAQNHISCTDKWRNVIFSDEKKFNLDGPDCYSNYWHDLKDREVIRSKRNFGGGSLMVWSAFTYYGKLPICFITCRMKSGDYVELLENVLVGFLDTSDQSWTFQHDNASIHVSKIGFNATKSHFSRGRHAPQISIRLRTCEDCLPVRFTPIATSF
jgi:transposase